MTRLPSCLSDLGFAALLQYGPDGTSKASAISREAVLRIKRGDPRYMERIGLRAFEASATGALRDIFQADTILVPVPRSQPFKSRNTLWPAMMVCQQLLHRELGQDIEPMLIRKDPIDKSALHRTATKRPGPEDHVRTLALQGTLRMAASSIVLVDDVVTRGASFLGAASLLQQAHPLARIIAFAAVQTMSDCEVDQMLDPVVGRISYGNGRLHREP